MPSASVRPEIAADPVVYVVEDDPDARESFGALLESEGFVVVLFSSCEEFLEAGRLTDPRASLLLDARFEGMSGLELLETLHLRGAVLPTVFVIGRFDPKTRARAARSPGVVAVFDKPVPTDSLVSALRGAIA